MHPLQKLEIISLTGLFFILYGGLRSAKKFIDNYKINIYMTHGTLNIYIYDTQHL